MRSGESFPDEWEATGGVTVKGKGVMETYLWRAHDACGYQQPSGEWVKQDAPSAEISPSIAQQQLAQHDLLDLLASSDWRSDEYGGVPTVPTSMRMGLGRNGISHSVSDGVREMERGTRRSEGMSGSLMRSQPDALMPNSLQRERAMASSLRYRGQRRALYARGTSQQLEAQSRSSMHGPNSTFQAIGQLLTVLNHRKRNSSSGSSGYSPRTDALRSRLSALFPGGGGVAGAAPSGPTSPGPALLKPEHAAPALPEPVPCPTSAASSSAMNAVSAGVNVLGSDTSPKRLLSRSKSSHASVGSFANFGDKIMQALRSVGPKEKKAAPQEPAVHFQVADRCLGVPSPPAAPGSL